MQLHLAFRTWLKHLHFHKTPSQLQNIKSEHSTDRRVKTDIANSKTPVQSLGNTKHSWNFVTCFIYIYIYIYRVSQEERTKHREGVPYVKLYWYNPKHLCPKLNGFRDNGKWSLKLWQLLLTYCLPNTYWNWQECVVYVMLISVLNIKVTCEWHKAIKLNYKNSRTNSHGCL